MVIRRIHDIPSVFPDRARMTKARRRGEPIHLLALEFAPAWELCRDISTLLGHLKQELYKRHQ